MEGKAWEDYKRKQAQMIINHEPNKLPGDKIYNFVLTDKNGNEVKRWLSYERG